MAILSLNARQRGELEYLAAHTPSAKERSRAQALLWLDEGQAVEEIADLTGVSRQAVYNWAERFRSRASLDLRSRLLDAPRSGRPPTVSGIIDPLIAEVIDRDPRDFGYHSTVWTAPLLMRYLERVHGVAASRRSIGSALERLRIRWKRPRHQLARRPDTWRQAKGG
ncbi:MAG: helix-turn-helix domain-containing protein [Candidatus Limnocylindrales bacterium]